MFLLIWRYFYSLSLLSSYSQAQVHLSCHHTEKDQYFSGLYYTSTDKVSFLVAIHITYCLPIHILLTFISQAVLGFCSSKYSMSKQLSEAGFLCRHCRQDILGLVFYWNIHTLVIKNSKAKLKIWKTFLCLWGFLMEASGWKPEFPHTWHLCSHWPMKTQIQPTSWVQG